MIWLAGLLACLVIIARTEFETDISAFLPQSPSPAQQILVEQLRNGLISRLILIGIDGAPRDSLARLSKDLAARLSGNPDFVSVSNGQTGGLEKDRQLLWGNRYLLSPAITPDHFDSASLHQSLRSDLALLRSDAAVLVKSLIPADPTGELLRLLNSWNQNAQPERYNDVWFSPKRERALLVVQTRAAGFDMDLQEKAISKINAAFAAARASASVRDARLVISGPGVFSVHTRAVIKQDAERLSLVAVCFIILLLWSVYRSLRLVGLSIVPVGSGILSGIAAVSLSFGSVHGITLGFGVTLIGEAVDYAIYLFTQTVPGDCLKGTLPRIWPTLRLGVMTSICGFCPLLLSSFTGLAQLGLFSIVGLLTAVCVARWVLPVLLPYAPERKVGEMMSSILAISGSASRLRYPLIILMAVSVGFIFFNRGALWDDRLASLSPIPQQKLALDEQLRREIGAPDVRFLLVVRTPDEQKTLMESERVNEFLSRLADQGIINGFDSPSRYLPSRDRQRRRQNALPDAATLQSNLDSAVVGLPFKPNVFAPFIHDVAAAKTQPLLDREDFVGTKLAFKLDSLLFKDDGNWFAIMPLRGVADIGRLMTAISSFNMGSATFLDLKAESDRLYTGYRRQALLLSSLGAISIVVLLFAFLRSPLRVFEVVLPLAGAVFVSAALLVAIGQKLTIFNLIGLLLVVGVGSNYALFFEQKGILQGDGNSSDRGRTLMSIMVANLATVIGFGVLSFARIPVLNGIGMTVGIGAVLSLIFSFVLFSPRQHDSIVRHDAN